MPLRDLVTVRNAATDFTACCRVTGAGYFYWSFLVFELKERRMNEEGRRALEYLKTNRGPLVVGLVVGIVVGLLLGTAF